jgi:hypothetical protein
MPTRKIIGRIEEGWGTSFIRYDFVVGFHCALRATIDSKTAYAKRGSIWVARGRKPRRSAHDEPEPSPEQKAQLSWVELRARPERGTGAY